MHNLDGKFIVLNDIVSFKYTNKANDIQGDCFL